MRKSLHILLYTLVLVPLIVTKPLFFPYISGKSIFIRVILTAIAVGFLILLFKKEEALRIRLRVAELLKNKVFLSVCAFFLFLIISTIFAHHPYRAFLGDVERAEGLVTMLYFFGFFLFTSLLFERKQWLVFFKLSLLPGVVLFINAIIAASDGVIRPGVQTGNPIYLAVVFLFTLFCAGEIFYDEIQKAKKDQSSLDQNRIVAKWNIFWKIFAAVMIPVSIVGVFITETRGVIAGMGVGVLAVLILMISRKGNAQLSPSVQTKKLDSHQKWAAVALGVLLVCGVIFFVTKDAELWNGIPGLDRLSAFTFQDNTTQTRLISFGIGMKAINPVDNGVGKLLIGWGPENFSFAYNTYYNPEYFRYETAWFDRAHNKLMDVLVMNGLLGFLAYMAIWISALWVLLKRKFSIENMVVLFFGIAYFVQNLFVFDAIATYIPFFTFIAFAAYLGIGNKEVQHNTALQEAIDAGKKDNRKARISFFSVYLPAGLTLFYLITIIAWTAVPYGQIRSYTKLVQTQESVAQKDLFAKFAPYTFAQEVMRSHFLKNSVGHFTGKEQEAKLVLIGIDQMLDMIKREPYNPRYYISVGDAYDALGKKGSVEYFVKAEEMYRAADALAPDRQDIDYAMGYNLVFQKKYHEAIELLEHTVQLDEKVPGSHFYLGMVLTGSGDVNNYGRGLDELILAEELGMYSFGADKNGPQAIFFLLFHFYQKRDSERILKAADVLEKLVPDKKAQIDMIRNEVIKKTWKSISLQ